MRNSNADLRGDRRARSGSGGDDPEPPGAAAPGAGDPRTEVNGFARNRTKPLVDELHPAAVKLTPALQRLKTLSPELKTLVTDVGPLSTAARTGLPALRQLPDRERVPFLAAVKPYLGNLVPVINYLNVYRRELAGFFANSTAASEGQSRPVTVGCPGNLHYLRISNPINPEALATYQKRPSSNRSNPYLTTRRLRVKLLTGLPVFGQLPVHRQRRCRRSIPGLTELGSGTTSVAHRGVNGRAAGSDSTTTPPIPSGPACRAQALSRQVDHRSSHRASRA